MARKILLLCAGPWDLEALARPDLSADLDVLRAGEELLEYPWYKALRFDVHGYLRRLVDAFSDTGLDGVIGTGDYPACLFQAHMANALSLPGPSLESVLRLSHKLYSRELQQGLVPEATPAFEHFDPFGDLSTVPQRVGFPCFIKPVKGTMSIRARRVDSSAELEAALRFGWLERWTKHLLLRPYAKMLAEIGWGRVPVDHFVAESLLEGAQVTVDGFVQSGRATIMGIVDSVMYPGTQSFMRFDYPSRLPAAVLARMAELVRRLMEGSGFDHSCFNVELFWQASSDRIAIIEVNPRMSYQFADLYEKVDGRHGYQVQIDLASGRDVQWRTGRGQKRTAASFVLRRFGDARVRSVPSPAMIRAIKERHPDAIVKILCAPGERLSDHDQDVGSFRYGIVNLGAASFEHLLEDWGEVERGLPFDFC